MYEILPSSTTPRCVPCGVGRARDKISFFIHTRTVSFRLHNERGIKIDSAKNYSRSICKTEVSINGVNYLLCDRIDFVGSVANRDYFQSAIRSLCWPKIDQSLG